MGTASSARATEREGRRRFGRLLADALRDQALKQEDLAAMIGTTQSSVSGWINGKYEPAAETVFTIERRLGMEPGHLSRPLGYLPVEAASGSMGVEAAIAQSNSLGDEEKAVLVSMYRVLASRDTAASRTERVAGIPSTRGSGPTRVSGTNPPSRYRSVAGSA
jgi:transcriptional regulator with XRE-family HTH domain